VSFRHPGFSVGFYNGLLAVVELHRSINLYICECKCGRRAVVPLRVLCRTKNAISCGPQCGLEPTQWSLNENERRIFANVRCNLTQWRLRGDKPLLGDTVVTDPLTLK
jgi:hypothetical protein